jgi:hypothetical protein
MQSATCGDDRLIVASTAHVSYAEGQWTDSAGLYEQVTMGRVSEFQIKPDGSSVLLSESTLDFCSDVGSVSTSADCSVVAVMCKSVIPNHGPADARTGPGTWGPGAADRYTLGDDHPLNNGKFAATEKIDHLELHRGTGTHFWGDENPGLKDRNATMWLLEWSSRGGAAGQTRLAPDKAVLVNHAIGGWSYGQSEAIISDDATRYQIGLKVAIGGHEGAISFTLARSNWLRCCNGWTGFGEGHVHSNRLVYNTALDAWGKIGWTDGSRGEKGDGSDHGSKIGGWGTFIGTVPPGNGANMQIDTTAGGGFGGPQAILSREANGYVAVAVGPDPTHTTIPFGANYTQQAEGAKARNEAFNPFDRLTVGITKWPSTLNNCTRGAPTANEAAAGMVDCEMKYIPSAYLLGNTRRRDNHIPAMGDGRNIVYIGEKLGKPAMQHIGPNGKEGERFLLGYATGLSYPNIPENFYLAEVDANGRVYGEPHEVPGDTAWGEEDVWVQLPKSGCVAWPFTWKDTSQTGGAAAGTQGYGDLRNVDTTKYEDIGAIGNTFGLSNTIRITTVCPSNPTSPNPAQPCTGNCQYSCPAGSAGPNCEYTDVGTCSGRGTAMDNGECMCQPGDEFDYRSFQHKQSADECQQMCECTGSGLNSRAHDTWTCDNEDKCTRFEWHDDTLVCELYTKTDYLGKQCQYSRHQTCNGRGAVDDEGFCTCDDGFGGEVCSCSKSATCKGATVIRGRGANTYTVHYLEIEQPSGAIEPIGTSQPMSKKDINYELRLRHGEHLVKVQQIQYPINHKNFFDNLGFSWSFTTSHGRTMSLQGWFGWTDYRAQARVKPDDGYMCEGDTGSCAAAPINTFTAPAGCEIYSFEVGPSGNQKLTNAPTRPIGGDAEVCHADKHCNGNGVALGNTADGCQCMCNDGYGADDCSCDKSPACLGATVIRARASNVPVPVYVEIEHPDGKLKQYGDASFRGQTNEEFRLLPDECLVSAALTQFPANHEPTKDHEWYTWKFVTSKEREFGFKGWWSFTDGQCTGGTCESVEVSTFTASVGESIHALEFDLNNVLSGVITYPCGGKIPTTPTTAPPPPWVGEEDMYYQKSGVGTWGGTCTCPSGEVYYVGDNNDYCGSLACNGGVAGTCDQSLPQSGWLMAVDCGAPRPTSSSTTVLTTTQKPIATPKPTTTTEGQPCKSGSPGDPSKCKCGFDSVVDTAPGCTLTVCKVCPGCKEESSQLSSELDDERAKAAELQRAVDSLKQQVLAAQSCKA